MEYALEKYEKGNKVKMANKPKKFYWLKLSESFFISNTYIKKLRRMENGSELAFIYLRLQTFSLKTDGIIHYKRVEDNLSEEIALDIEEDPEKVHVLVDFLIKYDLLIDIGDDKFMLPEVRDLIGKETENAQMNRNRREKEKAEGNKVNNKTNNVNDEGNIVTFKDNNVKKCYTEIEIEKEKEKEKEIEKEKEKELEKELDIDIDKSTLKRVTIPYQQILDLYNTTCLSLPKATKLTKKRQKLIRDRYKDYSLIEFQKVFEAAENSPFLKGQKNNSDHLNWIATLDFLLAEDKFVKCLEGGYSSFGSSKPKQTQEMEEWYKMVSGWASEEEPPDDNSG